MATSGGWTWDSVRCEQLRGYVAANVTATAVAELRALHSTAEAGLRNLVGGRC